MSTSRKAYNAHSSSSSPDVTVIIVNWNLKDELGACLESLNEYGGDLKIETIVVDNGSTDGSTEMIERDHPQVRLICNTENAGFSRANNQAMAVAGGRYYFLLNNDTLLYKGSLPRLVEFMENHDDVGICGPRVVNGDGTLQVRSKGSYPTIPRALGQYFLPAGMRHTASRSLGFYESKENIFPEPMDWISGCAMLVRRTAVERVGVLDADIFMYLEDVDWCYRMKLAGWQVWNVPDSVVLHYGGRSMNKQSGAAVGAHAAGLLAFYSRYHGRGTAIVFRAILGAGYAVQAIGWLVSGIFGRRDGLDKIKRMFRRRDAGLGR
ncbi:MAG: glycosyltransferase family 2 protein [Actinobacteria bacterium]|nr:glycosyltransferase family 2 protein [Actinomycetota bacterium]